ncbi:hypothetical protein [Sodalis-like endosymbiont of Proechinophthirus fluctus]|nr:hypothetical protein [Sodalis-like endosymbiont of Proechinophthirus fluctus]
MTWIWASRVPRVCYVLQVDRTGAIDHAQFSQVSRYQIDVV